MQKFFPLTSTPNRREARTAARTVLARRGLTLLELIVVLAILVALSGMVIPLIQGLGYQTNASTNAAVVGDVNRSVGTFHTRFEKYPDRWDSLRTTGTGGGLYSKLHPTLSPLLTATSITATQAESLNAMGVFQLYDHDENAESPSTSGTVGRSIASDLRVAKLNTAVVTSTLGGLLSMQDLSEIGGAHDYVVVGLGSSTSIRGSVMAEVPMLHSADPSRYYARVLCVFMVPMTGTEAAKYVGCFMPDGSSLRSNLERYHNTGVD
jgi:prepilin-type N-terminal cleavage/methylation domain-containing protein